jgi:glycine/D-amino acid oxidase-like deaminating enzyme
MPTLASLWLDTVEHVPRPSLGQDVNADVCVVGAGITGLSAALELARGGRSVVVLEGRFVGAGASGYNTAKLSSLHGLTYAKLESSLGEDAARSYGQANERGIERAFELAGELGVDCDLRRKPNLTYSESPDDRE